MNQKIEELKNAIYSWEDIQKICNLMIFSAVEWGISDIHIEPLSSNVRIRFRLDWILENILEYQTFIHTQIVARFKIMADLKIDETRIPQDWRISTEQDWRATDLRISTIPTVNGEKVVMRIIDKSKKIPKLKELWLEWRNKRLLFNALKEPNWVILTSWPTGSGKSTTLYSCLSKLNTPEVNIMTFEDPVENVIDWLNQSQVKPEIWYTFAKWLRTALRQDPDIMMVWEIRDKETIDIAIEASLTWHLVFSTIHTNSSSETITRILNMWVNEFLIPAAVNIIIAQRLVRTLCNHCKENVKLSSMPNEMQEKIKKVIKSIPKDELLERVDSEMLQDISFYKAIWCDKCNKWYSWRTWIYEIMKITNSIKEMILEHAWALHIEHEAIKEWMISLELDWMIRTLNWDTSIEEIYRVVDSKIR